MMAIRVLAGHPVDKAISQKKEEQAQNIKDEVYLQESIDVKEASKLDNPIVKDLSHKEKSGQKQIKNPNPDNPTKREPASKTLPSFEDTANKESDMKRNDLIREDETQNQMNEMIEKIFEQISKTFVHQNIVQEFDKLKNSLQEDLSKAKGSKDIETFKIKIIGIVEEFSILETDMLKGNPCREVSAKEFPILMEQFERKFITTLENMMKELHSLFNCPQKKQLEEAIRKYFSNVKKVSNGLFQKLMCLLKEKMYDKCPSKDIEERFLKIWENITQNYKKELKKEEMKFVHHFIDDMENKM